jgi:hypothetical protein
MTPPQHILSFAEYAAIRHPTPYVLDLSGARGRLVLFGGRHTSDPADPMFESIARLFANLAPAFALHEGTPPQVEPNREIAIRRHGEAGLVRHLAAGAGIETASMDIPLADEARLLRRELSLDAALVFLVVRQLASFNRKTARMDRAAYFAEFFATIGPPLGLPAIEWARVEQAHERVLGRPLVADAVSAHETDPTADALPTQRIARRSNRLRDEHMLRELIDAVAVHRRVFAAVGVSHAVMLERALRVALNG